MSRCPNCDYQAQASDRYCPRCGMDLYWNPDRQSARMGAPDWMLALCGVISVWVALMIAPVGLPILLIIYLSKRGTPYARGIQIGCMLITVLVLGALAICIASMSKW